MEIKKPLTYIACAVVLVAGSYWLGGRGANSTPTVSESQSQYPLLSKRIFVDEPNDTRVNFNPLRTQLTEYMTANNLTGSLYFEYLPTGTSIRVSGDEKEIAASLIKLPAAMELYKASELGLIDLDQNIALQREWLDSTFGTLYLKGEGYQLTLREACEIMITKSDNTALKAVAASLEGKLTTEQVPLQFLDVDIQQNVNLTVSISSRGYSSFLKCLYFSCYLNKENSNTILELLTQSDFNDRMVAGVGPDVKVAHKIGTYWDDTQSDCGIVYVDRSNYIFCTMIDGPNNQQTNSHIASLSKIAYEYVTNNQ